VSSERDAAIPEAAARTSSSDADADRRTPDAVSACHEGAATIQVGANDMAVAVWWRVRRCGSM
jgi:hypothetical protein